MTYFDVLQHTPIHTLDGDGGTIGVTHRQIMHPYFSKVSIRTRAHLESAGTGTNLAVLHQNVLA